jgi:hypothetical protein
MNKLFAALIILSFTFSCKEDKVTLKGKDLSKDTIAVKDLPIPPSCKYMDSKWIADRFGVDLEIINVRDGGAEKGSSGCFFQWAIGNKPNAGMFIQVFTNPMEDETKAYASARIAGLKAGNAGTAEGSVTFKDFTAAGDEGAYSDELSQYFWRLGENYVFMFALNMDASKEEKLAIAKDAAKHIMENFGKLVQ